MIIPMIHFFFFLGTKIAEELGRDFKRNITRYVVTTGLFTVILSQKKKGQYEKLH